MMLNELKDKIMGSFSLRLSLYILSVAAVVFIAVFAVTFHSAMKM